MIIHMVRLSSSALPPPPVGAVVVVVVACAPSSPLPWTSRSCVVVNVPTAGSASTATSSTAADSSSGASTGSSPSVGGGDVSSVGGGVVPWVGGGAAVVGGSVVGGAVVGGVGLEVVVSEVVVVVGGSRCSAATDTGTAKTTSGATTRVARRTIRRERPIGLAGRPACVDLASSIHSTLSAPSRGRCYPSGRPGL
jgi:hypothetical protein